VCQKLGSGLQFDARLVEADSQEAPDMPYRFSHPTVFTDAEDAQGSARTLIRGVGAALYVIGGLTMVVTLLAPSAGRPPLVAFLPVGLACFGLALYLALAPRVPDLLLLAVPPLGTLNITAIMSIEQTTSGTPFFYLWPVLVAAYFFQLRDLVLNVLFVAAAFGTALLLWVPVADGRTIMFVDTLTAVGVVAALVFVLKSRVDRLVAGMRRASTTDPLTGVLNRGAFARKLEAALVCGRRVVLAVMDLDHFKRVNDRLGHPAGDRALRRFCEIVEAETRAGDVLGRLGGEEFGLLLVDTDAAGAHRFAERLRATVAEATASEEVPLTVSIGLAQSTPATTGDDLLRTADDALYAAKGAGRNRVKLHGVPGAMAS
jgi:diguanylate cyclase (GGDEF)-like protein